MSTEEKKRFLRDVVVFCDTREQENTHILLAFESLGVKYERRKMDFGDYSFQVQGRDFSLLCVIERKANIEEFYGNITKDRDRIEKEFRAASDIASQFTLLIENCTNEKTMKNYLVPDEEFYRTKTHSRKVQNIGEYCYATIRSWQCGNRYRFNTAYVKDTDNTAKEILEIFYWWWHNYKKLTASRRNRGG